MTKDLTEQWKNGELEDGFYYVECADGLFGIMSDYSLYRINLEHPDNQISILSKVPSYEEYSRLEWYAGCGPDRIVELNHENRKLKDLLKECRNWLKSYRDTHSSIKDDVNETICKIDEVLNVAED